MSMTVWFISFHVYVWPCQSPSLTGFNNDPCVTHHPFVILPDPAVSLNESHYNRHINPIR